MFLTPEGFEMISSKFCKPILEGNSPASLQHVNKRVKDHISKRERDVTIANEEPFFVADIQHVYEQYLLWQHYLPMVRPFYAVKCNNNLAVLRLFASLDAGFDCASIEELEQVLRLGVDPSRIIYAAPIKAESHIARAALKDVRSLTVDSADEIRKISRLMPDAQLFLRIFADDPTSKVRLGRKYGATLDSTEELLSLAKQLALNVIGISFHIGSGASKVQVYADAVRDARIVYNQATSLGFKIRYLDIGGGFTDSNFASAANVLTHSLRTSFANCSIEIVAEPGRFFVANAFSLACKVIGRRCERPTQQNDGKTMLFLNDGIYGNFKNALIEPPIPQPHRVQFDDNNIAQPDSSTNHQEISSSEKVREYTLWGRTCDGSDLILDDCELPDDIQCNDWLCFPSMGAYTLVSSTSFNGFPSETEVVYVAEELLPSRGGLHASRP